MNSITVILRVLRVNNIPSDMTNVIKSDYKTVRTEQ